MLFSTLENQTSPSASTHKAPLFKKKKKKEKKRKTIVLARRNVRLQNCMSEEPVLFVVSRLVQKKIHNQGTRPTGDLRPRLRKSSTFTEIPVPCLFCQATSTSLAPVIPLLKSSTRSGRRYRQVLHCSLALKSKKKNYPTWFDMSSPSCHYTQCPGAFTGLKVSIVGPRFVHIADLLRRTD